MLSNTSKYAIRAVIYLSLFATKEKKLGIKEISKKLEIPAPFLGKILQLLARQKVLISTKGPNGGFALGKPPQDISLMSIIETIDGKETFDKCVIRTSPCSISAPCSLHDLISHSKNEMKKIFISQTIDDLATEFKHDKDRIKI
jgi:Rrf2 family protein